MTTTNNPAAVQRSDTTRTHGVGATQVNRPVRSGETKAFYKTTEFIVLIMATVGVLLASFLVKATDGHSDYFQADKACGYVVILSVGYFSASATW